MVKDCKVLGASADKILAVWTVPRGNVWAISVAYHFDTRAYHFGRQNVVFIPNSAYIRIRKSRDYAKTVKIIYTPTIVSPSVKIYMQAS